METARLIENDTGERSQTFSNTLAHLRELKMVSPVILPVHASHAIERWTAMFGLTVVSYSGRQAHCR